MSKELQLTPKRIAVNAEGKQDQLVLERRQEVVFAEGGLSREQVIRLVVRLPRRPAI